MSLASQAERDANGGFSIVEKNTVYFTITGTCYKYGQEIFKSDMKVTLVKEPDNEFDKEAIKVTIHSVGTAMQWFYQAS